jgi:hypothetical protein
MLNTLTLFVTTTCCSEKGTDALQAFEGRTPF